MNSTDTSSAVFRSSADLRHKLDYAHWYVAGSALVVGITVWYVKLTPLFVCLSALVGVFVIAMNIVTVRRNNQAYSPFGVLVAIMCLSSLHRAFNMPPTAGLIAAAGILFLTAFTLLWLFRPWVKKFCGLEDLETQARG